MAPTRAEAIARMRAALARVPDRRRAHQCRVPGRLMSAPAFVEARAGHRAHRARARTSVRAARRSHARECGSWRRRRLVARSAGKADCSAPAQSPWDDRGGWALGVRGERRLKLREGELEREIAVRFRRRRSAGRRSWSATKSTCSSTASTGMFQWIDPYLPVIGTRRRARRPARRPCPAGCSPCT